MAHTFGAVVLWSREAGERFTDGRYSRAHAWSFDGGITVPASSAASSVPLPFSREDAVDPEEAFVAALASCHMLFVLHGAARRGFVVDRYRDEPVGTMVPNKVGRLWMSTVTLRPAIAFAGERRPGAGELEALHHEAHAACFLANSVRTTITVEPANSGPCKPGSDASEDL